MRPFRCISLRSERVLPGDVFGVRELIIPEVALVPDALLNVKSNSRARFAFL